MTAPIIDILSGPCGCGGNCCCGHGDGTLGDVAAPTGTQQSSSGSGNIFSSVFSAIGHLFGGSSTPACAPPAGCFKCKIDGQGGIAGCIDNVTQQWIAASQASQAAGWANDPALLQMTQAIIAGLNNAAFFTPQSDAYLTQAKQIFQQRATDIMTRMTANAATQTAAATSLVSTSATGETLIFGMPATTLLLFGGAGFVLLSLMKKDS